MEAAVITGDIVQSTKLTKTDRTWLVSTLQKTLKIWDKDYGIKSEVYRGDSFQCLVKEPMDALRFALLIRTYIRSLNPSEEYDIYNRKNIKTKERVLYTHWMFDARLAIGIGKIDPPLKNIKTSDGEAYQLSGRKLDDIKNSRQMMGIDTSDDYYRELETEMLLLDHIIGRTTALQCEVINLKLLDYTEIQIAKEFDIRQPAVNQRSISGGWNVINAAVERYEEIYNRKDSKGILKRILEYV